MSKNAGAIIAILLLLWLSKRGQAAPPPGPQHDPQPDPPMERPPGPGGLGDIDGDGVVTSADATLIARYLSGQTSLTPEQLRRADVNGDGRVTAVDSLFIGQYVNGVRDSLGAGSHL